MALPGTTNAMTIDFAAARTAADFLRLWLERRLLSPAGERLLGDYYGNFRGLNSAHLRHWYNQQTLEVLDLVRRMPGARLLEVGVGTGTETLWLALNGAHVTAIDAFEHCATVARERLAIVERELGRPLACRIETTALLEYEAPQGFDILWLEQVIHHMEPREASFRKLAELVRPGGYVAVAEANALNPLLQAQLLRARGLRMTLEVDTPQGRLVYGNERILSLRALSRAFAAVGIEPVSGRYFRLFPSHPFFDRLFGLERALAGPWLAPLCTHYNYVGRKVA